MARRSTSYAALSHRRQPRARRAVFVLLCLWVLAGPSRRLAAHPQLTGGSGGAAQASAQIQQLEPGQTVARELAGGELHSFRIALAIDHYLTVIIEQHGVDVTAAYWSALTVRITTNQTTRGRQGSETVSRHCPGRW